MEESCSLVHSLTSAPSFLKAQSHLLTMGWALLCQLAVKKMTQRLAETIFQVMFPLWGDSEEVKLTAKAQYYTYQSWQTFCPLPSRRWNWRVLSKIGKTRGDQHFWMSFIYEKWGFVSWKHKEQSQGGYKKGKPRKRMINACKDELVEKKMF